MSCDRNLIPPLTEQIGEQMAISLQRLYGFFGYTKRWVLLTIHSHPLRSKSARSGDGSAADPLMAVYNHYATEFSNSKEGLG